MTPEEALCFFESFLKTAPANPYSYSARVAVIALKKMISEAPSEDKSACELSLRLCLVQGRMAIFHKWIVKTSFYIKCNDFSTVDEMKKQRDFCLKEGVIPHNVQRQIISYYESGTRKPNLEDLMMLADFYNVSIDYLVGRTDTPTTDKDLRFVCDYTGLSDKTVTLLHSRIKERAPYREKMFKFINKFITDFANLYTAD